MWSIDVVHCFGLLVLSALLFKARVHNLLTCFIVCTLFLRFTSGTIPVDLLMASMVAHHIPYMYFSSEVSNN